jgi:hypothetical protein
VIALAAWLLTLPLRVALRLGFRGTVILVCLVVLAVTAYGVVGDLGLLDPAEASPARQAPPSSAARADIPTGYLALYRRAAPRCPGLDWSVLAGIGKVESDHGRARLPGVRSGWNHAGAVPARHQRVHQRQQLAAQAGPTRTVTKIDRLVGDLLDPQPLGQRRWQQQPGPGDRTLVIEGDVDLVQHHVRGWHRRCPPARGS